MKRRSSYKITFFDRHGPDGALRLKVAAQGVTVFGLAFGVCMSRGVPIGMTLVISLTLSTAAVFGSWYVMRASGAVALSFLQGRSTTPYENQFSEEQALVMKRDYATALALFEHRMKLSPADPRVRMAAADLYASHGEDPRRAAELYREVQRLPELPTGHDVYVSNKLADLYLGPLKEPRRALVEFRRLIERYPGSTAANNAKLALTNLKSDLMANP